MKQRNFVSANDLSQRYGVDLSTIWRWQANGKLPRPVQISKSCSRWPADEIEAHEQRLLEQRKSA